MIYGALFTITGIVLLTINYLLVRATFPPVFEVTEPVATPPPGPTVTGGPVTVTSAPTGLADADAAGSGSPVYVGAISSQLTEYRNSVLQNMVWQSLAAVLVTLVVALLLGWFVANRALLPVATITATARRLGADTLGTRRLALSGPRDEVTELADTFDEMLDRLAASFDSQRRFVANASHELRTPLAVQRTLIEVALAGPRVSPALRRLGTRLLIMNRRSEQLIDGLLVLARSERGLPAVQRVRLDEIAHRAVAMITAEARSAEVTIVHEVQPRWVAGDAALLERMVVNLLQNAVRHNVAGGAARLRIPDTGPALQVCNSGPPVPPESIPGLFEPFRRGGAQRTGSDRGVGLGLSIVASVVAAHRGTVSAEPGKDGGLCVTVQLPAAPPAVAVPPSRESARAASPPGAGGWRA
ncbi:MAG TPA: HAMP domain-containing sensor histidine kinase [Pseudonocardiaceae bacterium]